VSKTEIIKQALLGERARQILENDYRRITGDNLWSVSDLTARELVDKIRQALINKQ